MTKKSEWWTAPAEAANGSTILVTGRKDVAKFRKNPRFSIRIEITWRYEGDPKGMPQAHDAQLMEDVTNLLQDVFDRDPVAVMTGIFTGDNERNWIFYSRSTAIFGRKLNETLSALPLLPLTITAENDGEWRQYDEMAQTEIDID